MKGGECKLPIQEDHRCFLNGEKIIYTSSKKIAIISAFLLLIAMSLMIVFTFQSVNGISELRQEVEHLKTSIKILQKKIDEEGDDRIVVADPINSPKNDHNETNDNFEYSSYDYDEYYDPESYPNYNEKDDSDEYDSIPGKITPGLELTKDAKIATAAPRIKRSVVGYTQSGAPINSDSHNEERRRNLTAKNYQNQYFSTPSSYSKSFYPELKTHQDNEQTTPAPRLIHSRKFRVRHDDNSRVHHQKSRASTLVKSGDSHSTEENHDVEFTVVGDDHLGNSRTRHRQRRLETFDERHVRTGRMKPLPAAHFSGDTSKYVLGQHDNFNGNGHLRHPQRTFVDWVESSWFYALQMDRHFSLTDGILTMKESGLYFIYAQIYYYDEHDINGFRVYKNENETLLQCTTMTHSVERVMKGNTCFTASVEYLNENDRISLGDLSESRYSLFEPGKSFFGVIKLGDVKIK